MRTAIYIRVSTDDQANSVAMQRQRCLDYCRFAHKEVVEIVGDVNVSGSIPLKKRKGGKDLTQLIKEKKIDSIITLKLDRMFRDTLDCLQSLEYFKSNCVSITFIDMGGQSVDTSSPMGKLFVTMLSGFAEMERNLISERTKSGIKNLKDSGKRYNGTAYFGFKWEGDKMVEDKNDMKVVKNIIKLLKEGKKKSEIISLHNLPNYRKINNIIKREIYKPYWK